jgi:tetratricopeptide (TPR) repeat protein
VIAEFERLVREQPGNLAAAEILVDRLLAASHTAAAAGRPAEALTCLSVVARWCESRRDHQRTSELQASIERLERAHLEAQLGFAIGGDHSAVPSDASAAQLQNRSHVDIRLQALQARACIARGDATGAARHLTAEMAEGDPTLMMAIAEIQLRGGQLDRGIALVDRVIARDLALADDVVLIAMELAQHQPDAGFMLVDMVADAWARRSEWTKAAAAFEAFIAEQPNYAPALARLRRMQVAAADSPEDSRVVPFRLPSNALKSRSA